MQRLRVVVQGRDADSLYFVKAVLLDFPEVHIRSEHGDLLEIGVPKSQVSHLQTQLMRSGYVKHALLKSEHNHHILCQNPHYHTMKGREGRYGLEMGPADVQSFLEHPDAILCGICGKREGWWKPTVGSYVCTCGSVRQTGGTWGKVNYPK